jgi:hypothetical protein
MTIYFFILKVEDAVITTCYILTPSLTFFQCSEIRELQEKVKLLEQQLATDSRCTSLLPADECVSGEHIDELKRKIKYQVIETLLFLK